MNSFLFTVREIGTIDALERSWTWIEGIWVVGVSERECVVWHVGMGMWVVGGSERNVWFGTWAGIWE